MDIYPNGKTAVLSANVNAQSDLYLISTGRPNIRRLTNDVFDNLYPSFIPGTKRIVFASNRESDSLSTEFTYEDVTENFNIFEFDIDEPSELKQLTNFFGQSTHITIPDSSALFYLSDKSGIYNLYKLDLEKNTSKQITAFGTGIKHYDIIPEVNYFTYVMDNIGDEKLYFEKILIQMKENFYHQPLGNKSS